MNMRNAGFVLVALLASAGALCGDEVVFKANGNRLAGRVVSETATHLVFELYDGRMVQIAQEHVVVERRTGFFEEYTARAAESPDTAEGHFQLGNWCAKVGLTKLARQEWSKALERDPRHAGARAALGQAGKTAGDPPAKEPAKESEPAQTPAGPGTFRPDKNTRVPIGFVLTATYDKDASRAFLDAFAKRVADGSRFLWETTEGQMYVQKITVTDKKTGGDLRILNLDSMKIGREYARTYPGSHMEVGGLLLAYTFTHELFHLKFGLPDEYGPRCEPCLMSANPRSIKLCTSKNHVAQGASCWDRLKKSVPALVIPAANPPKPPKVPATQMVVVDN